ncbi:MAG: DUF433 domain-containing protein [Aggregatilineales bacterium]
MAETVLADRIVVSRDTTHGKPRVEGTRIMVHQILDLLAAGKTMNDVIGEDYFPELTEADVRACIAYASQIIRDDRIVPSA